MTAAGLGWLRPSPVSTTVLDAPRRADGRVDLDRFVRAGAPLLLESAPGTPGAEPWSLVVVGTAGRLVHDGTTTRLVPDAGQRADAVDLGPDPFAAVDEVTTALEATPDHRQDLPGRFAGGLAGALSYDLARLVEHLPAPPPADRDRDLLDLRVVTDLVAVDHRDETAHRIRRPVAGGRRPGRDADLLARLRDVPPSPSTAPGAVAPPRLATSLPRDAYHAALARIAEHLAAGDVFQVNLAQRLRCAWTRDALDLYARLRAASPAPHAALFQRSPTRAIASVSPETFLRAEGRTVRTRPIKGTRPRGDDRATDQAMRAALLASAKDRAEHVMVVDMERNDLGRVCRPGSVRADDLLEAEPHPTVWQLVSTVTGQLRDDVGWGALLRATFPSGSITGTPKVRAMRLIDELEPARRSWYCGSLGWVGPGGAALSVAIRTAVLHDGVVDHAVGGGIVADSDPDDEIAESWHKAAAFLRAVGHHRAPSEHRHNHAPRRFRTGAPGTTIEDHPCG